MEKQKTYAEHQKRKENIILMFFFLTLMVVLLLLAVMMFRYKIMYHEAIKQGTENTMIGLQMVVACQNLTNVTMDQIEDRTIEMFILNKGKE